MEIKLDDKQFQKVMNQLDTFAGKKAMVMFKNAFNRAGFTTRKKIVEQDMPTIFKNLNNYTRNALIFKPLNYGRESFFGGTLEFRKKGGAGVGAGIYLMPEEWGGGRMFKGFEHRLQERGLLPDGMYAVPTKHFDRRLNTPAGMVRLANELAQSSVSRIGYRKGKVVKASTDSKYFCVMRPTGRLEPGIYMRTGRRSIQRIVAFVDKVTYKQVFSFYSRTQQYFAQFFFEKVQDEITKAGAPK